MIDTIKNGTTSSQSRSPRTIAVDNFLRKTLRVGDPRDPQQVANALLQRYPEEAERARRESEGLSYTSLAEVVPIAASGVAALAELAQAQDDLERDSQALMTAAELKDIRIELTGWARTIRRIADDGLAAARLALDSVQHDRALSSRNQLVSFARISRYVGTLSNGAGGSFRRLAQSCDSLAGLILVAMGEGLAASGITRSTSLVRVSASELQSRRNAVINALRSLTGSSDTQLTQNEWPRGLEAYRRLVLRLQETGQADLRALLDEAALAQAMDDLIDLGAGNNVNGLRELSTASAMLVGRFERLIQYGRALPVAPEDAGDIDAPESPPLAVFTSALQLFVDGFVGTAGNRLLYIARPPIVIYGLYGAAGADDGAQALINLVMLRGRIAEQIDCFAGCECDEASLRCQTVADFALYCLDRAIDAYAVGTDPDGLGDPESRAAAFGLLIENATFMVGIPNNGPLCNLSDELVDDLRAAAAILLNGFSGPRPRDFDAPAQRLVEQELRMTFQNEVHTERLARSLAPACRIEGLFDFVDTEDGDGESLIRALIRGSIGSIGGQLGFADQVTMPATVESSLATLVNRAAHENNF